ncbi:hypothetical protein D3C76_1612580 [compost metagenome]
MKGKNPRVAPTKTAVIIIASRLADVAINIVNSAVADMADIPAASPSRPSIKLTAFVTPIIHNKVIGKDNIPKSIV